MQLADAASHAWITRQRVVFAVVALVLLAVIGTIFAAPFWLNRYLRSENFQRFLEHELSTALRADAHIAPLQWQEGNRVSIASVRAVGNSSGPIVELNAGAVRADVRPRSLLSGVLRIDDLRVEKLGLVLGDDGRPRVLLPVPEKHRSGPKGHDQRRAAGWLLPTYFEIGEIQIANFSLTWNPARPDQRGELGGVELHARPAANRTRDTYEIDGRGGRFTQANFPAATLDSFHVRVTGETLRITDADARLATGGSVRLTGSQGLTSDRTLDLAAQFADAPLTPFLPNDWRARLRGLASGRVRITGPAEDPTRLRASGRVELHGGQLEALPFLNELALLSATGRFRSLSLQQGRGDFDWDASRLEVTNLQLESDGLVRIEGSFVVEDGQLHGELQVGVARSAVRWLPGASERVFDGPARDDGYAWTTMRVSGPANAPREDLSGRLVAAARDEAFDKVRKAEGKVRGWLDALKGR